MDPLTLTSFSAKVGEKVFPKLAEKICSRLESQYSDEQLKSKREQILESMYLNAWNLRKTRTLINREKDIDVEDIFVSPSLSLENKTIKVSEIDLFPVSSNNIGILGGPGYGKSTFLKTLCAKEYENSKYFPIFIEFRRINASNSLQSYLLSTANNLGLELDNFPAFKELLKEGKLAIFMDGYDELQYSEKEPTIQVIESLIELNSASKIIISSRLENGIETIKGIRSFRINPPELGDIVEISRKLFNTYYTEDREALDSFCKSINSPEGVEFLKLITSPLMVVLSIIYYQMYQNTNVSSAQFIAQIFDGLLTRHDSLKHPFSRKFSSGLNLTDFKSLYSLLCFELQKEKGTSNEYTKEEVDIATQKASSRLKVRVECDAFINDVIANTSFIIKDGIVFHFIHNFFREFFAAQAILTYPDEIQQRFWGEISNLKSELNIQRGQRWSAVLGFYSELYPYGFIKFHEIPALEYLLSQFAPRDIENIDQALERVLGIIRFELIITTSPYESMAIAMNRSIPIPTGWHKKTLQVLARAIFESVRTHYELASHNLFRNRPELFPPTGDQEEKGFRIDPITLLHEFEEFRLDLTKSYSKLIEFLNSELIRSKNEVSLKEVAL